MNTANSSTEQTNTRINSKSEEKKGYNPPPVERIEKPPATSIPPIIKEKEKETKDSNK